MWVFTDAPRRWDRRPACFPAPVPTGGPTRHGDDILTDETWTAAASPHVLTWDIVVKAGAKLTIEPRIKVEVPKGKLFEVEHCTSNGVATGALRALGTAERPIVFTSAEGQPAPGGWGGLWFGGADCLCSLATCSNISRFNGAVLITGRPESLTPFITNTTFRDIAGHAIVEGWSADDDTSIDFQPINTFEGVSDCVQTHPCEEQECPRPRPACW